MTALQRRPWVAAGLAVLYPPQCLRCRARIDTPGGVCGACWRETPFVMGAVCDGCGAPLEGHLTGDGDLCDDCLRVPRPWDRGRAALLYAGAARSMVMGLKHRDRTDMAPAFAGWMIRAGSDVLSRADVVVPVPAHWRRTLKRRYNQAALLTARLATETGLSHAPRALRRIRATRPHERMSPAERTANMADAITPGACDLSGCRVCLVDDVMTSGATLAAATSAAMRAGAAGVDVLVLARAVRTP